MGLDVGASGAPRAELRQRVQVVVEASGVNHERGRGEFADERVIRGRGLAHLTERGRVVGRLSHAGIIGRADLDWRGGVVGAVFSLRHCEGFRYTPRGPGALGRRLDDAEQSFAGPQALAV